MRPYSQPPRIKLFFKVIFENNYRFYLAATKTLAKNSVRLDGNPLSVFHHIQESPVMSRHVGVRLHIEEETS